MSTSNLLKATGLQTYINTLDASPGALLEASNVIIDRNGVIEPRRGLTQWKTVGSDQEVYAQQLLVYKDRILAHYPYLATPPSTYSYKLAYDNGVSSQLVNFTGDYLEVESGVRIKSVELNGNLYFTSSNGIKKISAVSAADLATTTITDAGGVRALDVELAIDLTGAPFLPSNSQVGYRIVWGVRDANNNLILGFPSPLNTISNSGTDEVAVKVKFYVPDEIVGNSNYFYQIYRTQLYDITSVVSDELKLVYEGFNDSSTNWVTDHYEVLDVYPETLRQANTNLYTNQYSAQGIASANSKPPIAKDITTYKNHVFFGNTQSRHTLTNTLLGVSNFTSVTMTAPITNIGLVKTITAASHGLNNGDKVVIRGTTFDGVYPVANKTANTFEVTVTSGDNSQIQGGAVVYKTNLSITKDTTTNYYWPVGRQHISNFKFNSATPSDYSDEVVVVYAAEDRVKYVIWFDTTGSAVTSPVVVSGGSYIKIQINGLLTIADICDKFITEVNLQIPDLFAQLKPSTTDIALVETTSSGYCTSATVTANTTASVVIDPSYSTFTSQQGIGVVNSSGQTTDNKYFILSSYDSASLKNEETTKSFLNSVNKNSNDSVVGYYVSSSSGLPGEFSLEARTLDDVVFTLSSNNSTVKTSTFNEPLDQNSESEKLPNRLYYSKESEPDNVPISQYFDVGPRDKAIKRILGLRDSLFIFKEEGIYRLWGNTSTNFQVVLFDSSALITASDTAAVLNNQIYLLTSQGVARVSETGVQIISRPIENLFVKVASIPNYEYISFGVSYEADRSYILLVPDNTDDNFSTKAYRFNTFTQTWTSWDKAYNCGIVHPAENKLYFGATEDNYIEVERKTLGRKDYADRVISNKSIIAKISDTAFTISNNQNLAIGDSIVQRQTVTLAQMSQLVNKLNIDPTLNSPTLLNLIEPVPYDNLGTYLVSLAATLTTADGSTNYSSLVTGSNNFTTLQSEFNAVVTALNASPNVYYNNYKQSTGTVEYEAHIIAKNNLGSRIDIDNPTAFIIGECEGQKGIESSVIWTPQHFGDPTILKHVRESKIMFEAANFEGAYLGFSSDISGDFEEIGFHLEGDGSWGNQAWSNFTWGGKGLQIPFRTLVPQQKQRCRLINTRFRHVNSRNQFAIYGISFVFNAGTERTNK